MDYGAMGEKHNIFISKPETKQTQLTELMGIVWYTKMPPLWGSLQVVIWMPLGIYKYDVATWPGFYPRGVIIQPTSKQSWRNLLRWDLTIIRRP